MSATTTIEFSADTYDEIIAHAREGTPREVCGVLGGERSGTDPVGSEHEHEYLVDDRGRASRVRSVHRAENVARSPRRAYLLDPEAQLAIMEGIEADGEEVVGFYHSHPTGPPRPSAVDERRATWDGRSYVICLPDLPFVGSWRWNGEEFVREVVSLR